ncbi:SDR family oxidoreductase [Pedobacter sp. L105]|uniref:SDR family oxidoreductase n=1 Tax=Pedobacter sp. L105 TaxID=1641871 RepID=UPI00131B15F6|nr:NmrA family NAD(P)-binding protein [Pedobacter sp. L105]
MKITVTGSLGYISTPLIKNLVKKGHLITVISSNPEKKMLIEAMGAKAAIGTMEDLDFLTGTFTGADAVYCMLAPYGNLGDPNNSANAIVALADIVANNYVQAIKRSGVKRVVYLSSIAADMEKGAGLIVIHHHGENTLNTLPVNVNISFIRAGGFYKNFLGYVNPIKNQNIMAANYGGNDIAVFVSNIDIADAIAEELESHAEGRKIRYVASDELTCDEVAGILGNAIGKPDLNWITVSDEQQLAGLKAHGMNDSVAHEFVQMNASIHNGSFYKHYNQNKPILGKVSLKEFAKEFAAVYHQQ